MPRIELNGEGEPVWLTPHLRDPQPEGEREREDAIAAPGSGVDIQGASGAYAPPVTEIHIIFDISDAR